MNAQHTQPEILLSGPYPSSVPKQTCTPGTWPTQNERIDTHSGPVVACLENDQPNDNNHQYREQFQEGIWECLLPKEGATTDHTNSQKTKLSASSLLELLVQSGSAWGWGLLPLLLDAFGIGRARALASCLFAQITQISAEGSEQSPEKWLCYLVLEQGKGQQCY